MFREELRKLTANYTEEEYREYLVAEPEFKEWHPTPSFKFTEEIVKGGFHRMKDIYTALCEIADATGYSIDFLIEVYDECDEDESAEDRIITISDIALEHDF